MPGEALTLRRIYNVLDHPDIQPISYFETIKNMGLRGTFAGWKERVSYCLIGNGFTLALLPICGSDYQGLGAIACAKNLILPVFLGSNARQMGLDPKKTLAFVIKGVKDPATHLSFFFRNLAANSCLLPGFALRDYYYQATGETNQKWATLLGFGVSAGTSTLMNAFLKPFFTVKPASTENYPISIRWKTAAKLPAKFSLLLRELPSLGLIFSNTSPKSREEPENTAQQTARPK